MGDVAQSSIKAAITLNAPYRDLPADMEKGAMLDFKHLPADMEKGAMLI